MTPVKTTPPATQFKSRRAFLKTLGTAAFAAPFITRDLLANPPSARVRHAAFGAGGMAWSDLDSISKAPNVEIVAMCDVDTSRMAKAKERFPNAKFYQDYRELLDKEARKIDSVNVGTPDHMHAAIAISSMQLGKHVYCQKPLTHNLYETRRMTEIAREKKLVTQMGIQIHSESSYRTAVAMLRAGIVGKIKEVWSFDSRVWGDTTPLPDKKDSVPENFAWDLWLGVAAARPFIRGGYYHPGNWRKRLDFGVGTLGDMACHIFDPVFGALDLGSPTSVVSTGAVPNQWNWAESSQVTLTFAGTKFTANDTLKLHWSDGAVKPPQEVLDLVGNADTSSGSIFIGTDGVLHLPHISSARLYPREKFAHLKSPYKEYQLPRLNHWAEFIKAVRGEGKTECDFDYAGPLTEAVLFGSVAVRFPNTLLKWNPQKLTFDLPAANAFVRRDYRSGWAVKGL